ncbi:hypothetical protein P7C71_g5588, partial [Lecanoromycetidae sp. Uapishka_2]
MVAHTDLTKPIVIETKVPAPLSEQERANREVLASRPVTIELRSCSELVEFASPVEHFSGDGKIKTIQDYEGNPIIFAVGTDAIAWRAIPDPEGEKVVKSLHLGFLRGRQRDRSSIIVFAGTKSQKQKAATIYAIDPTPEVPDPWKAFSPAVDAQYVKSIQPGSIVGEDGVFVLTNHLDQTKCILYSLDAETFKKTNSKSILQDSQGRLVLVSPATDSLKAPTYVLEISQEGISHRQEIHAAQRIVEALSSIDSIEKLASATSTTGAPIFAQGDLEKHKEGFEESTELLRGFPAMMEAIGEKDVGQPFADSVVESSTVSGFGAKVDAGNPDDEAAQAQELSITQFLGDALEWIRNAAKTIVKASYKILYKGVKLVLNLAGKIISLVIDTVGPLLHTIDQFLKEKLGLDFKKLFKWLGLTFDNEKTKDNQRASLTMRRLWLNILTAWQILKASITKILALPGEVVRANTGSLENLFDTLAKDFKPFVGDRSKPKVQSVPDPLAALRNSKVGWLLDNPVIAMLARFTPISIIMEAQMEAMEEEYGPSFQIPSLTGLLNLVSTTLVDLVGEEVKIVVLLLQDLWEKIKDVIHNPSLVLEKLKSSFQDVFYAIFDAIKALVKSIWQLMGQVMEEISNFLRQEWKIPLTTALFEWYADQNFSFLNLTTFIIARVLGLVVGEDALASYIDIEDDLMCMTEAAQTSNLLAIHPETATAHYPSKVVSASPLDQHAHRAHPTFEHIEVAPPLALQSSKFQHEQKLSKDAKARLHKFEKQSKICTCVVGLLRFSTVIVEAVHAMSVAKFKKGDLKHNDGSPKGHPGLSVSQATLITITTGLTAAGSVAQFFIWQTARDYSEEVRHHLDDHYQSQLVGHWGGLGCDMGALVASIVGLGLQMKKGSGAEACASASVLLLGAGSLCEIFGVHVVPECSVNDPVSTSADWLEASATVSGLVAHFAAHKGAVKVAMGAAVGDGFLSLLSLILDSNSLGHASSLLAQSVAQSGLIHRTGFREQPWKHISIRPDSTDKASRRIFEDGIQTRTYKILGCPDQWMELVRWLWDHGGTRDIALEAMAARRARKNCLRPYQEIKSRGKRRASRLSILTLADFEEAAYAEGQVSEETPHTAVYISEEDEYVRVDVEGQKPDLIVRHGVLPARLVAYIMQAVSNPPHVQASVREQDNLGTSPRFHNETEIITQEQGRILNQASVNADCACSTRIEQQPSLELKTIHNVSNEQSPPLPAQSQQSEDRTRVDRTSHSSREQTPAKESPYLSPQDTPSLPLTQANLFRLGGSQSSSSVVSAEASEADSQSQRGNTDQRSQQSQSTDEMTGTPMVMRQLLKRNQHFIDHQFVNNPEGAERCKAFTEAGLKIINGTRKSDWSPEEAVKSQETIFTYKNENEATFLYKVWHTLLGEKRIAYQEPNDEEIREEREHWMESSWTKDYLRYKFNIDFARDSVPHLIYADGYEKTLLSNTPRVANPKPDIAFAVYEDAFTPTERELFDQTGCSLTGNGSYHEFASLDAKSMNASIEEAENQCMRSGSAMVSSRRKFNKLYAQSPQQLNQPAIDKPSSTQQSPNPSSSNQPSSTPPPSTETKSKIKTDTLAFTFAFATSQARLFVNWDLDQNGITNWHMHLLRDYNYNKLSDVSQLHHDIDNIMDWGVGKRKLKIKKQTDWIIQKESVPSVFKRSPKKRKAETESG